jgi:exopolysaccharide production protein ExoQ
VNLGQMSVGEVIERCFVLVALVLLTDVRMDMTAVAQEVRAVNPLKQEVFASIYAAVFLMLAFRLKRTVRILWRDSWTWVLVGFAVVSVLWSVEPEVTVRRLIALLGTTMFGVYLASRFTLHDQLSLVAAALLVAAVLSVAFVAAVPHLGLQHDASGDLWRGIYMNKNALGRMMAMSVVVMFLLVQAHWLRPLPWLGMFLSLGLLWLTKSKTSLVGMLAIMSLVPVYRMLRRNWTTGVLLVLLAMIPGTVAVAWAVNNQQIVMGWLGKDTTLTGRTDIWSAAVVMIRERPWLGYGFAGFWRGLDGASAYVCNVVGWEPPHGHNGILDLWLDLGVVGVILFGVSYTVAFVRALGRLRGTDRIEGLWPVVFLTFLILLNLTESTFLRINHLFWCLYVSCLLSRPSKVTRTTSSTEPPVVQIASMPVASLETAKGEPA